MTELLHLWPIFTVIFLACTLSHSFVFCMVMLGEWYFKPKPPKMSIRIQPGIPRKS